MQFLNSEVHAGPGDGIEVTLEGNEANVMVLDPVNFSNYRSGRRFRYYGGHYTSSPAIIRPPYAGRWYVVVDLGGYAGGVSAAVRVIPRARTA